MIKIGRVPRLLTSDKIVIIGSGKSLTGFNFGWLHKEDCYIITINESGKYVPFAHAWFTLDPWGLYGPQLPGPRFRGDLYAAIPDDFGTPEARIREHKIVPTAKINYLKRILGKNGLSEDPTIIHTGNSGYGAMGLAYHMRPRKILLLGIDGDIGYFYPSNKTNRPLEHLPKLFEDTLPQLKQNNISVLNGSPLSKITCFPRYTPEYALMEFLK
jgi:hypothetical protein